MDKPLKRPIAGAHEKQRRLCNSATSGDALHIDVSHSGRRSDRGLPQGGSVSALNAPAQRPTADGNESQLEML